METLETGLRRFTKHVASSLKTQVSDLATDASQKSEEERYAERVVNSQTSSTGSRQRKSYVSPLDDDAPGGGY